MWLESFSAQQFAMLMMMATIKWHAKNWKQKQIKEKEGKKSCVK